MVARCGVSDASWVLSCGEDNPDVGHVIDVAIVALRSTKDNAVSGLISKVTLHTKLHTYRHPRHAQPVAWIVLKRETGKLSKAAIIDIED